MVVASVVLALSVSAPTAAFVNPVSGVSIVPPPGWSAARVEGVDADYFMGPAGDGTSLNLMGPVPPLRAAHAEDCAAQAAQVGLVEGLRVSLARYDEAEDACLIWYGGSVFGTDLRFRAKLLYVDGQTFVVTYTAGAAQFEAFLAQAQRAMGTFRVLGR
ncbi:hypothetical protein [Deinococcus pimensis]|uniref:hypothetical protein n=1 Tax=Deinococcus pimensis TaxID=309888 RepID=UPI0004854A95|nr:hypothetical protein [Deinococcus pimensis]